MLDSKLSGSSIYFYFLLCKRDIVKPENTELTKTTHL